MEKCLLKTRVWVFGDANWPTAPPKSGRHNMKIKVNKHVILGSNGFGICKQSKALAISSWLEAS